MLRIYLLNSDKYFLVDGAMSCLLVATSRSADQPLPPHQLLQQHAKGDLHQAIYDQLCRFRVTQLSQNSVHCVLLVQNCVKTTCALFGQNDETGEGGSMILEQ